ncbi:MAG: K+/H+ antiporter subunit F [Chlamydiia bacterium]|nr:K+/H+ antiporter subunit F [Chlamydiia bacterium]
MSTFYGCSALLTLSMILALWRLFRGPTILDRILAFDALSICVIGLIILFTYQQQTPYFLDLLLIFCLLGFASTIAFMDFLLKKTPQEIKHDVDE